MTIILSALIATVGLFVVTAALLTGLRAYRLLQTLARKRAGEMSSTFGSASRGKSAAAVALLLLLAGTGAAQPVAPVDVDKLLAAMPAPAATPAEALRRARPDGAQATYQPWRDQLGKLAAQLGQQQAEFYRKYPTGVRPAPATPNRVSATQQASMDGAMAEFAAKMQTDPAFAQEFMKKSEAEQQAYITELLSKNGLKPAAAPAGATMTAQPASEPVNWIELMSELTQQWAAYLPDHAMANLLHKAG